MLRLQKKLVEAVAAHRPLISRAMATSTQPGHFDFQDIEGNTPPAQRPYRALSVSPSQRDGHYSVLIDGRNARTRLKLQPLEVPSLGLAVAIALEYDMQNKRKVEDITMPLTWLASVAIDRAPEQRKAMTDELLGYLGTDLVYFRAPRAAAHTSRLAAIQEELLDPIVDWLADDLGERPSTTEGLFSVQHHPRIAQRLREELDSLSDWQFTGVYYLSSASKSISLAYAFLRERLDSDKVIQLCRLEENFQMDLYGKVEGGHDIEISSQSLQILGPSFFIRALQQSGTAT